jgi:hypothetical protein
MKNYFKLALLAALIAFFGITTEAQQNFLGQTTLAAAVNGQYLGPGPTGNVPAPTLIQVTSATNIIGIQPNLAVTASASSSSTNLYIDREQMRVTAVNGTLLTVVRGVNGTAATPHASGAMVLFGPARFFYVMDPGSITMANGTVSGVACVVNNVVVSPWLNVRSGAQWLCSSDTLTWVPGWHNQGAGSAANVPSAGTEASAAGTNAVLGPVFAISGTNAIVTFTPPVGFDNTALGGGCFTVIPKGIFTWTAAGNISVAGTTTAITQNVTFCWNPYTSKWVPSRVA